MARLAVAMAMSLAGARALVPSTRFASASTYTASGGRADRRATVSLGLFDWLASMDDDEELSPEASMILTNLCRTDGWDVACEIGRDVARAVGGSGVLATTPEGSATALLKLPLKFTLDAGYSPPQGSVRLLRPSRFILEEAGFWKVDADTDDGVPVAIQWRMRTTDEGIRLGEQELVPPGPFYFNVKCAQNARGETGLCDGRLTVKEDLGSNVGLFQARGILAEFKIVGTFEMRPCKP